MPVTATSLDTIVSSCAASTRRGAVLAMMLLIMGCGWAAKVEAISRLEGSRAAYRACAAQIKDDPRRCETERKTYEADLADAGRPRGVFTWWPWF